MNFGFLDHCGQRVLTACVWYDQMHFGGLWVSISSLFPQISCPEMETSSWRVEKNIFFPVTCWWNNHLEIAHIIATWLDSFAAYTHKSAGCPDPSKYTIRYVLFIPHNYDINFVKFQELFFTIHNFLYFQDFHAVEFSRVVTRSLWVVFHQTSNLQNEQSLLLHTLELLKASKFCQKRLLLGSFSTNGKLTKRVKFVFSSSKDFKIKKPPLCQKMWLSIFHQVDGLQNEQNLTFETPNFISEKMID